MSGLPEKKDRNKQIYQDKLSGLSWADLIRKYNLSYYALWRIINREKNR